MVNKLLHHEPLNIGVVGSSITYGRGVERGTSDWFTHFSSWLQTAFPASKVAARNGAVPLARSEYIGACLEQHVDPHVDLVFIEVRSSYWEVPSDRVGITVAEGKGLATSWAVLLLASFSSSCLKHNPMLLPVCSRERKPLLCTTYFHWCLKGQDSDSDIRCAVECLLGLTCSKAAHMGHCVGAMALSTQPCRQPMMKPAL